MNEIFIENFKIHNLFVNSLTSFIELQKREFREFYRIVMCAFYNKFTFFDLLIFYV